MSLEELIGRCKKEERIAQEELYRKFSRVLFGLCLKYSRNKTEAEDSLHDSFMTIYEKIGQFKHKGSFEGWMKRITINTVMQKYRKTEYLSLVTEKIEEEAEVEAHETNIDLKMLLKYIQELPNKYRLTFNMYVLDGYTHQEISEQLGTSIGTSKSNLSRARIILKERIEKDQNKSVIGLFLLFANEMQKELISKTIYNG